MIALCYIYLPCNAVISLISLHCDISSKFLFPPKSFFTSDSYADIMSESGSIRATGSKQ
jgi:hypothetical protein